MLFLLLGMPGTLNREEFPLVDDSWGPGDGESMHLLLVSWIPRHLARVLPTDAVIYFVGIPES